MTYRRNCLSLLLLAALAGCTAAADDSGTAAASAVAADSVQADSATGDVQLPNAPASGADGRPTLPAELTAPTASPALRGLYVNRFGVQSTRRMARILEIARTTEVNAVVLDMKDEFGLNYRTSNPEWARLAGSAGVVRNLEQVLDTLKANGIVPIARIVVFKDSVAARTHPEWTIRQPDGSVWRDRRGLAWVNPYHRAVWEYNIGVAEELVKLGFSEIQFDYIRFPEPYRSLPQQVFPGAGDVSKPRALAEFLAEARGRLHALGVRSTADVFGLVTTVRGPLEIGQHWELLAPVTDVLLPMVYPSHYPRGAFGIAVPNADPYNTVKIAIDTARVRNERLGITAAEHVRPWIQAFTLGQPAYTAEHVAAQKRAVYDAGYDGWILWHPGSNYEPFLTALERELVSRKASSGR